MREQCKQELARLRLTWSDLYEVFRKGDYANEDGGSFGKIAPVFSVAGSFGDARRLAITFWIPKTLEGIQIVNIKLV